MKNVVIFGDTGFIGRRLVRAFLQDGNYFVRGYSPSFCESDENYEHSQMSVLSHRDISAEAVRISEDCEEISAVIYLAGLTKHEDIATRRQLLYRLHSQGVLNAVKFAQWVEAREFIYVSSCKARENNRGILHNAKVMAEVCAQSSPLTVIARPFNVYGRGQDPNYLIPHIVRSAIETGKVLLESVTPVRDFVHVDDVALKLKLLTEPDLKHVFSIEDIGSGESISVGDVVGLVAKLLQKEITVVCGKPERTHELLAEYSKPALPTSLPWKPRSLEEGIVDVIEEWKEKCKQ